MIQLSVNKSALKLVERMLSRPAEYGVEVHASEGEATIIDAGVQARGGYKAGKAATEICLGGYGRAEIFPWKQGCLELPSIHVYTDHPAIATLGCQLAGWRVKEAGYQAMASGPARALALKPKKLFDRIDYRDQSETAVLVLESSSIPGEAVTRYLAGECGVDVDRLYILVTPTTSVSGLIQISGRIVETAVHKLVELGFDPKGLLQGSGYAPIAPIHPNLTEAMGRSNDMLLYGGVAHLSVHYPGDEEELETIVKKTPSKASKDYGRPFSEIFRLAGGDFYKIDPLLFAPASILVNNTATGRCLRAGRINPEILEESISI